jgi:hypothetical protein
MATPTSDCDHGIPAERPCADCRYRDRVWELEQEGMTTSDAQGIADLEIAAAAKAEQ